MCDDCVGMCLCAQLVQTKNKQCKSAIILPGSYQVRPHLIPMTEQMWPIQLSRLSYLYLYLRLMGCVAMSAVVTHI